MKAHDYSGVVGFVEPISIEEFGVVDVLAKIDTGAYSGAVHCVIIEVSEKEDNHHWLRFQPVSKEHKVIETKNFETTYTRSASGHRDIRYIVPVTIKVRDSKYKTKIGLSLRDELKFPILVGRRFLRENNLMVDVRINQEYDSDGALTS